MDAMVKNGLVLNRARDPRCRVGKSKAEIGEIRYDAMSNAACLDYKDLGDQLLYLCKSELACLQDYCWTVFWAYVDEVLVHNSSKTGLVPTESELDFIFVNTDIKSRDLNKVKVVDKGQFYFSSVYRTSVLPPMFSWDPQCSFFASKQEFRYHVRYAIVCAILEWVHQTTLGSDAEWLGNFWDLEEKDFYNKYLKKTQQWWKRYHPIYIELTKLLTKFRKLDFEQEDLNALRYCWPSHTENLDPITKHSFRWHAPDDPAVREEWKK